ncbi:hypothetical protein K432DRAFT_412125 [Lepidopterella palustris CBS 459.81]|uniref:Uncharacterized protein n=1 Tax=Lepidopterella palustris CBS 459.81 TaxID=1314670 RepID=A0A8E2DW28_9PEZI|nr:hypothetical protein K432DRAFT_412125 [Lepidopterella palustris CBS 459.81]
MRKSTSYPPLASLSQHKPKTPRKPRCAGTNSPNTTTTNSPQNNICPTFPLRFLTPVGLPNTVHNDQVRKLVRVQAMRAFLHEKELAAGPGIKKARIKMAEAKSQKESSGKFKLASWTRKWSGKRTGEGKEKGMDKRSGSGSEGPSVRGRGRVRGLESAVLEGLGGDLWGGGLQIRELGVMDALPIPLGQDTHRLLYHYHHNFTQDSFAVNSKGSFFSFAVTDITLLHAILGLVAQHFYLSRHIEDWFEASFHYAEAVRMVNERLGGLGEGGKEGMVGGG